MIQYCYLIHNPFRILANAQIKSITVIILVLSPGIQFRIKHCISVLRLFILTPPAPILIWDSYSVFLYLTSVKYAGQLLGRIRVCLMVSHDQIQVTHLGQISAGMPLPSRRTISGSASCGFLPIQGVLNLIIC